jgi:predicted  nucleic acid-binding Zn-ribbon protein
MEVNLFKDKTLSKEEMLNVIDSECYSVEDDHSFLKPFTEEELNQVRDDHTKRSQEIYQLKKKLEELTAPIKGQLKPIEKEVNNLIKQIDNGGDFVTERVYLYPDYDNRVMGVYDSHGMLIKTRPMSRQEKQLSINAERHLNKAM